jgi:hypothetical protein
MNAGKIDSLILSSVGKHWKKVAMVIVAVAKAVHGDLPADDETYQSISERIQALVSEGRIVAQGDTKNWRFGEVRLNPDRDLG